jgi:hypothetical protein
VFKKDDSQTTLNDPKFTPSAKENGEGSEPDTTDQAQLPPPDHEEFIKDFEELVNSIAQNIYQGSLSPQFSEKFDEFSAEIRESIKSNGASMDELIKRSREVEDAQGILRSATQDINKRLEAIDGQVGTKIVASENKLREELEQQHLATKGELTKEIGEVEGRTTQRLVVIKKEAAKGLAELEQQANSRFNETSVYLTKLAEQVNRHGSAQVDFANKAREEFVSHKRLLWAILTVQTLSMAALAVYWYIFR